MQFNVKLSKAPFSARKGRLVIDLIRGKNINKALEVLQFVHKRPARYLTKLLRSCIANVEYYNSQDANKDLPKVDSDELIIAEARVDEGPLVGYRRRWNPRARGAAFPINKRTCHLKLVMDEPPAAEEEEDRPKKKRAEEEAAPEAAAAEKEPEKEAAEPAAAEETGETEPGDDRNGEE